MYVCVSAALEDKEKQARGQRSPRVTGWSDKRMKDVKTMCGHILPPEWRPHTLCGGGLRVMLPRWEGVDLTDLVLCLSDWCCWTTRDLEAVSQGSIK